MTAAQRRQRVTEAAFQQTVIDLATLLGWHHLHVRRSRVRDDQWATSTNIAGWPDLFLWHPLQRRQIAAELKSDRGSPTADQLIVLASLAESGVEAHIWRPRDWDDIERILRPGGRP